MGELKPVLKPLSARQIYHGRNWVPVLGQEEEEECLADWVMEYTRRTLEDVVDLNPAEKIMMNLWNRHVYKYQGRGMMHMDEMLMDFVTERGRTIVELNLYRNFVLHLSGLHQADIIIGQLFFRCVNKMLDVMKVVDQTDTILGPVWKQQRDATIVAVRRRKEDMAPSPPRMLGCSGPGRLNSSIYSSPSVCLSPTPPGAVYLSSQISIGHECPSSTLSKNVPKSINKRNPVEVLKATKETGSGPSEEGRTHWSNDSADEESRNTEVIEEGQEVASFLASLEGGTRTEPGSSEGEDILHLLTEEPDSDQEGEEEAQETTEEKEIAEGSNKRTKKEAAVKDFIKLQEKEYRRIKELAKDQKVDANRVVVFSISDSLVEHIEDQVAKESSKLQAFKNFKELKKRKKSVQLSEAPFKKTKIDYMFDLD